MRNLLLSSVTTLMIMPAVSLTASEVNTHIHTDTPIELKSVSDMSGFKLASVCFLGNSDCSSGNFNTGDTDYDIDTIKQCRNEGFNLTSCSLPAYSSEPCPYNDTYFAKCAEDKPKACKENGFTVLNCGTGEIVDTSCPYDSSYKNCKCDPCEGYDYTYAQATAQGYIINGSCLSCSRTKYKRIENPCSGYLSCDCGGATGANFCYSGTIKKFDSCKPCCNEACPAGTTETNPGGCGGYTQNECKTKTCYYGYQSCFSPYYTDCCDDISGCGGPGFCSSRGDYCSYESDICRERGGVPHISCNYPGYVNYDNYGWNGSLACEWY